MGSLLDALEEKSCILSWHQHDTFGEQLADRRPRLAPIASRTLSLEAGAGRLFAQWGASFLVAILAGPTERVTLEPHFDLRVPGGTVPGGFVTGITTMEQNVEMSLVRERMLALLATFFAALALILACIGLYGGVKGQFIRAASP